ncbi:hypothetical protein ES703_31968 [subsurface metagenome]
MIRELKKGDVVFFHIDDDTQLQIEVDEREDLLFTIEDAGSGVIIKKKLDKVQLSLEVAED